MYQPTPNTFFVICHGVITNVLIEVAFTVNASDLAMARRKCFHLSPDWATSWSVEIVHPNDVNILKMALCEATGKPDGVLVREFNLAA